MTASTVKTVLAGITSPSPLLPVGRDRDPAMSGGTIVKWRPASTACFPSQASGQSSPTFDLLSGTQFTDVSGGVPWAGYNPTTGGFESLEGGGQGLRLVPAIDLGANPSHEILLVAWYKLNLAEQVRGLFRIGGTTYGNSTRATAANQIAYETNGAAADLWIAGQHLSAIVPLVADTVYQDAFHIIPNSGSGLSTVNVYRNGVQISSATISYTAFAALASDARLFEIGVGDDSDRVRLNGSFYEGWLEDLTLGGRNAADLVAADYARNSGVFS